MLAIQVAPGLVPTAAAQTVQMQEAAREYAIGPGPLPDVLNRFAAQSGALISADGDLIRNKTSPGLTGRYTAEQALLALLSGTDLQAVRSEDGSYSVRPAPAERTPATVMPTVRVEDSDANSEAAAGEHSYTSSGPLGIGRLKQTLRETPHSVSVLTRQRLDDQSLTELRDAMDTVTGVSVYGLGGGVPTTPDFISRGYRMTKQINGTTTSASERAEYDLAVYDRIEVLRGPAGLLQGTGEPGGVVNLIRKRPQSAFALNTSLSGGSWDYFHGDVDVTRALNTSGSLRGRAVIAARDRDFMYDVVSEESWTAYGILELDVGASTTFGLSASSQHSEKTPFHGVSSSTTGGFLDLPRSTFIGTDWAEQMLDGDDVILDVTQRFAAGWAAEAKVRWHRSSGESRYAYIEQTIDPAVYRASFWLFNGAEDAKGMDADINVSGPVDFLGRQHELVFGYSRNKFEYEGPGGNAFFEDRDLFDPGIDKSELPDFFYKFGEETEQTGLYAMTRVKLRDSLTAIIGARLSDYTARSGFAILPDSLELVESPARADSELTPYGGIVWDITQRLSLYASYADIFIPQGEKDYLERVLEPRIGWQAETGIKGEFYEGRLNASVALFRLRDSNRAVADLDHIGCGGVPDGTCYRAAGLVQSEGWELEVSGSPAPGWQLIAGYSNNKSEYLEDADPARVGQPFVSFATAPERMLKLWSLYRFDGQGHADALAGWSIGAGLQSISELRTSDAVPLVQPGYTLVSAQIGYRFNERTDFALTGNNLTDRVYYRNLRSRTLGNFYGEPRNFLFTMRYHF